MSDSVRFTEIVLYPQVKDGVSGLYDGAEVVLGPDSGPLNPDPEQQFINQKMRPGSGVLSVQVLPDGPTRVLQVRTHPKLYFEQSFYVIQCTTGLP